MMRSSLVVIFSLILLNWFYNAQFDDIEEEEQAKANEYSILFKFLLYLGPSCSAVFTAMVSWLYLNMIFYFNEKNELSHLHKSPHSRFQEQADFNMFQITPVIVAVVTSINVYRTVTSIS